MCGNGLETTDTARPGKPTKRFDVGKTKKRSGIALLIAIGLTVMLVTLTFGGIYFLNEWFGAMKLRAARINQVGAEMTEALRNQMSLYAVRVHEYLRTRTDSDRDAASARWFSKAELDAKSTYSYDEIREKFKTTRFDSVDRALTGLGRLERFDISILEEGRTYENDVLIVFQTLVEIKTEDGAWVFPLSGKRWERSQRGGKNLGMQMAITKIWDRNGLAVTIPMQIEGTGKNFWVGNWVD